MKRYFLLVVLFVLLVMSQAWAQNSYLAGNYSYKRFPNMDSGNTNPYGYDKDVIYVTVFEANQWINKSVLATTGIQSERVGARERSAYISGLSGGFLPVTSPGNGTRIYIKDIPDKFLRDINGAVRNAFLIYLGAQTFNMANGSTQVFPVFQLVDIYGSSSGEFKASFDKGIEKTSEEGFQHSRINGKFFGRYKDRTTLYVWEGGKWVNLGY